MKAYYRNMTTVVVILFVFFSNLRAQTLDELLNKTKVAAPPVQKADWTDDTCNFDTKEKMFSRLLTISGRCKESYFWNAKNKQDAEGSSLLGSIQHTLRNSYGVTLRIKLHKLHKNFFAKDPQLVGDSELQLYDLSYLTADPNLLLSDDCENNTDPTLVLYKISDILDTIESYESYPAPYPSTKAAASQRISESVSFLKSAIEHEPTRNPCIPQETFAAMKSLADEYLQVLENRNQQLIAKDKEAEFQKAETERIARFETDEGTKSEAQRQRDIRIGKIPIRSVEDAAIFYSARDSLSPIISPAVVSDGAVYSFTISLDKSGGDSHSFIGRIEGGEAIFYCRLRVAENVLGTKIESSRYNVATEIVGRYVANEPYTTVIGEEKIMPIFDVIAWRQ